MRAILVVAALAAFTFSASAQNGANSAGAPSADDQAGDRLAETLFAVPHDRVADAGGGQSNTDGRVIVSNDGSQATIVAGCEASCTSVRITLHAPGQADVSASGADHDKLIFTVPAAYTHSLANFGFDLVFRCGESVHCAHQWAVVRSGPGTSLRQRGLPAPPTTAEWNAAGAPPSHLAWVARPTAQDLPFFYPVRAMRANVSGSARLQCLAIETGALRCRTADESPSGAGFGEAALRLSSLLRVQETDASGQSVLNHQIVIPIRFEPPATQ